MSDYHINVFYSDEDECWVADIPDLEMCSAFGATAGEAVAEVEQAKQGLLEVAREGGLPIPKARYRPAKFTLSAG
jgi:predicted RNase H-like HicB family nuclease